MITDTFVKMFARGRSTNLEVMRKEHGDAHIIAVVGDAAFSGQKHELDEASKWLDAVCAACGCDIGNVCIVPGNHDIDRKQVNGVTETRHAAVRAAETETVLDAVLGRVLSDPASECQRRNITAAFPPVL